MNSIAACNPKPKPTRVHPPVVGLCAAMMVGLDAMANGHQVNQQH